MSDVIAQFCDALQRRNIIPPEGIIGDGKLRRCDAEGRNGKDDAAYLLHLDGIPAGGFENHRDGLGWENWRVDMGRPLAFAEVEAHRAKVVAMQAEREADELRRRAEARERAAAIWEAAAPADDSHPYLARKGVRAHGLRLHKGALVVPMRDTDGALHSLQFIAEDGTKRYLTGGRIGGCYFSIGKPGDRICVAEGYATGASIHEATGFGVAVAFDAGNLRAVAEALKVKRPAARLILAADDDYRTAGNPGITKATEAALAVGGLLAVPDFGADRAEGTTDFNDLAQQRGREAVERCIAKATACNGGDWPDPLPLTVPEDGKPYPIDALPGAIGEAVAEVVGFVQCPPALAACSALSALSLAGQALADVRRADGLQGPTSLFLLAVAESGERKTTCDSFFLRAVREWEREQSEAAKPDIAAHAAKFAAWEERCAGIKARIREAARKDQGSDDAERALAAEEINRPKGPPVPSLIHADATPEALGFELARRWPSGGVMSSEAGIVFGGHGMGRDSVMRNLSLLNALWDGTSHRVERKTSESYTLAGARLTMGLAAQPETVRQFMEGTKGLARGNGFAARFLIAAPQTTQGARPFKDAPVWRCLPAFEVRLRELLTLPVNLDETGALAPPALTMADNARALWVRFHDDVEGELRAGGDMAEVRDVASKAADNVARLAALFHVYASGPIGQVGASSVAAAARIVSWHLYQARAFLGDVAAPREVAAARRLDAWLVDYCRREGVREVERRTIQNRGPNPVRGRAALDAALAELAEAGRVREADDGKRKLVRVNPALLRGDDGAS